ncbi:hypothetical protein TNCV_704051 [Trichonephila clavipes]|nr:hypothetical protein TNCV_704051 [Trichonephila clavipes]
MWVRLGSTDLMAGKIMFLRSNQGGRFDGNESVADSFRSDLVNFKSSCTTILGAFTPSSSARKTLHFREAHLISGEKKLSLQEALDLLNVPSEISDVLTDDFSDEEVPANNLLKFSLDSKEDDEETKHKTQDAVVHFQKIQYFLPQDAVL